MNTKTTDIAREIEDIRRDKKHCDEFNLRVSGFEDFYQRMFVLGLARKDDYNVVGTGEIKCTPVSFLVQ